MEQKATRKDWIKFIGVMLIFIIGMIFMIIYKVTNYWIWTGYIIIWSWLEIKIAKNIHLKWWVWVIILAGLSTLDLLIIKLIN